MGPRQQFTWNEFDVREYLPPNWREDVLSVASQFAVARTLIPTSVTSREASSSARIQVKTVGGKTVKSKLKWLYDLYAGKFRDLAQSCVNEPVFIAQDLRYAVNLNVQSGAEMRYECHVDSNPLEGLLYVTTHPKGSGGELVVSNRRSAVGIKGIIKNCEFIYPDSGKLLFFDAREYPHFVAPLTEPTALRVAVTMNYYTPSCTELDRPKDLNNHLFGEN